jgi:hypothetical protein
MEIEKTKNIITNPVSGFTNNLISGNKYYLELLLMLGIIFVILITLYFLFPVGFNKGLGQSVFLTLTFFYFIFTFVKFYNSFTQKGNYLETNYYSIFYIIFGLLVSGGIIYGVMNSLDVIEPKRDKKMWQTLINYITIIITSIISYIIYLYTSSKGQENIKNLPKIMQDIYDDRSKYTLLFGLFILTLFGLLIFDPFNLVTKYGALTIPIILFFSLVLFSMIYIYNFFIYNPSSIEYLKNIPTISFVFKTLYLLVGLVISGGFMYWILNTMGIFEQNAVKDNNFAKIFLNLFMLTGLFAVSYKLITLGGFLERSPLFKLITSTILFIPCLFVTIWNTIVGQAKQNKPNELIFLFISLFLFSGYFIYNLVIYPYLSKIYSQILLGGKQVLSKPIPTNIKKNVAGYQELNNSDEFNYTYGMSFWFYINSFPPSTNNSYTKPTTILSYGDNPSIKYDSTTNSLIVSVRGNNEEPISLSKITNKIENQLIDLTSQNINDVRNNINKTIDLVKAIPLTPQLDNNGNRLICKIPDIELQKWNNIIINYNAGTLDIFYNGQLIKSERGIVPYMKFDMLEVGSNEGIFGKVANIMYYKNALDYLTIHRLYSLKNPPLLHET